MTDGSSSSSPSVRVAPSHAGPSRRLPARTSSASRASEYPLLRSPGDSSPIKVSPSTTADPSSSSSASTIPTANPTRSNSPGAITPGWAASSPPKMAHPAWRQPTTMPFISS